ncbi:MAG: polyprenyl synthetase family protein [bacterium]
MTTSQRKDLVVPADKSVRDAMRRLAQAYCAGQAFVPPLALDEIEAHADCLLQQAGLEPSYRGFMTVLVANEVWRDTVAATPFERRILMLPKCVRSSTRCKAESDALGLLCEGCGSCAVGGIQEEAEALGYVVLVAEGTTAVSALLARGEADTIVGVSCLPALEKLFRPQTTHAIPGLAIPLLKDGCVETEVDLEWVREIMRLRDEARPYAPLDLDAWQHQAATWFESASLQAHLNQSGTETERMAMDWMAKGGKRWRPMLTLCVCQVLQPAATPARLATLIKLAMAVECFHKASLIHDDIEDGDATRYDGPALHGQHGVAVALNVGDLLIGEGYRLIAESGASAEQVQQMTAVAAAGHRTLCLGQGEELLLRQTPERLTSAAVLEIFRRKTAPAFDVALQLGAICAQADAVTRTVLTAFSEALGVAYQIRDDLQDLADDHRAAPGACVRPSLLLALAREELLAGDPAAGAALTPEAIRRTQAEVRTRELLQQYSDQAIRALRPLRHAILKRLLYRVAAKLLAGAK